MEQRDFQVTLNDDRPSFRGAIDPAASRGRSEAEEIIYLGGELARAKMSHTLAFQMEHKTKNARIQRYEELQAAERRLVEAINKRAARIADNSELFMPELSR